VAGPLGFAPTIQKRLTALSKWRSKTDPYGL
jgi:hypothetical protein